jgi:hypothetical protein
LLAILDSRPIKFLKYPEDVLEEYVLVSNVTSINPRISLVLPHHPCDWIYAGLSDDLNKIWDIDLMPKSWFRHYANNPWPQDQWHERNYLSLFRPESYIWSTFLRNEKQIKFNSSFDNSDDNLSISEKFIALNLMIENNHKIGIKSLKNKISIITLIPSYTRKEWENLTLQYNRIPLTYRNNFDHLIIKFARNTRLFFYIYLYLKGKVLGNLSVLKKKILN